MIAALLCLGFGLRQDAPLLRTILPSGAVVIVERMESAKTVSVQLLASARFTPETPKTHGWRHLLEHILARGPKGDIDLRLETRGMFLTAETYRDAMQFAISCPPDRLSEAVSALGELMRPVVASPERIASEAKVIEEEAALLPDSRRASQALWLAIYGETGLDPMGPPVILPSPEELKALQSAQFAPSGLVVSIAGPVDIDEATKLARRILQAEKGADDPPRVLRSLPTSTEVQMFGEARGTPVPSYADTATVGTLAAALAFGSEVEGGYVTYTPSTQPGTIILGHGGAPGALSVLLAASGGLGASQRFAGGKRLAVAWVERQMRAPNTAAFLRGYLICQAVGAKPETMLEAAQNLTLEDFVAGLKRLGAPASDPAGVKSR